ncbi:hypothetical protein SUGI_0872200 [Cryptomeria japonica]|uniref:protein GRIM REAPER n=1 Tax=Cryptomeria japonica TaxID=3369 RepID=UPI0024147AAB|nr:protein GRIM REAPER [Cryptomeria japonica]GLJ42120.1 hypothetical protein SUGI_0872200 [Cryptomeria japonica]
MASMAKLAAVIAVMALAMAISNAEEDAVKTMETAPRRSSRFLEDITGNRGRSMKCMPRLHMCDKNDVVGSLKSRCCGFDCTNVLRDGNNCGRCGNVCPFGLQCCNGRCLNVASHGSHCGSCNARCNEDQRCAFGMCSYA